MFNRGLSVPRPPIVAPQLSVIVPTHRRPDALDACLASLAAQTVDFEAFEVLVIDDGSPEAEHAQLRTAVASRFSALNLHLWRQDKGGPARARNRGVARARAPVVLFLNDDVTLAPDNVAAHMRAHAAAPREDVVFRGITEWASDLPDTAVMRWVRRNTFEHYDCVQAHRAEHHFALFHTCDLSVKRSLLAEFPFDEAFEIPCCEDTELALRLLKAGRLELRVLPEARSAHHHVYTLRSFLRWIRPQARGLAMLLERHPELECRVRGSRLRTASQRRRLARALWALARGRVQQFLTDFFDFLTLREIDRHRPRPMDGGEPYPEILLKAVPAAGLAPARECGSSGRPLGT